LKTVLALRLEAAVSVNAGGYSGWMFLVLQVTVAQQSFKPFASSEKKFHRWQIALDLSHLQTASVKLAGLVKALKCLSAIDATQLSAGKTFY